MEMTIENVLEILEKHKLHIPSNVFYELKADIVNFEEPTTKNDLAQERYQDLIEYFGDEKVAKTILESRKEFKAWLERLRWIVKRVDELDRELEQIKETTKNDLGVDCISREEVIDIVENTATEWLKGDVNFMYPSLIKKIKELPSVTPQPCEDVISRKSIKQKLQEHHDFFVDAYGGFSNLPQNDKSRVDEIINCIAMVVNEPSVTPQEPRWIPVSEKLPEINEEAYSKDVLLSLRRETKWDIDACRKIHITTIGHYDVNAISSDGVYLDTEGWVLENKRRLPLSDVLAWMPLPLPKAYGEIEE